MGYVEFLPVLAGREGGREGEGGKEEGRGREGGRKGSANRIFPSNSPDFSLRKYPVQPGKIPVAWAIRHNHREGHKVGGCVRDRLKLEKCSSSVGLQTCNPL